MPRDSSTLTATTNRRGEPFPLGWARPTFPSRKAPRRGLYAGRVFRDDQATLADPRGELSMRGWIVAIDATAEHRDGQAACFERAAMRLAVDSAREPAHDDDSGRSELPRARTRHLRAVRRA